MAPFINHCRLSLAKALGGICTKILVPHLILIVKIQHHLHRLDLPLLGYRRLCAALIKQRAAILVGNALHQVLKLSIVIKACLYQLPVFLDGQFLCHFTKVLPCFGNILLCKPRRGPHILVIVNRPCHDSKIHVINLPVDLM